MGRLRRFFTVRSTLATSVALSVAVSVSCASGRRTTAPPEVLTDASPSAAPVDEALRERLARLSERLEAARVEHHVPGMAFALVKDDQIVFARGFGYAELSGKRAADKHTLFAIGSSSKAFTSALVGTFVDDGKLAWDDPIETHIPELTLAVRRTDRKPTLRDAMCHRTGFTRMGVLWAGGGVSRKEMFATASKAEPWADYGKTFLYNNVVYATGGEAAARVGGKSWDALIAERLFEPLGMTASSTSATVARDDSRQAQGYHYDQATQTFEPVPMRNLDVIGPAGSINSNVVDMGQWLRMLLAHGEIDGRRVISEARLEDTWTPQIDVGGGAKYGLGWFVRDWNGHRVVEHGGNIDGYAAAVGLMPDDDLGFVLLTNVSATAMQSTVRSIVWESMLAPLIPPELDEPAVDLAPFIGSYVANFGPWDDARFVVTAQGGKMFVDVPSQMNYELTAPDGDGRWKFAMAPQIAASFETAADGKANLLRLHQGGIDFEMPREGWTAPAEIDLEALRGHLGRFAASDGKTSATVVVVGNRLAVDIPGQMVFELHKPDADGKWRFRIKSDIAVSFEHGTRKDRDKIVGLVLHQGGDETRMAHKADGPKLPTVAQLAKLRGAEQREAAIGTLGLMEATGTIHFVQAGVEGKVRIFFDGERFRTEIDLGRFGSVVNVDNGKRSWTEGTLVPTLELHGDLRDQNRRSHPLALARAWSKSFSEVEVTGEAEVEGERRLRLTLRSGELPMMEALVDPKTGDVVRIKTQLLLPSAGRMPTKSALSDYRIVAGLRLPFHMENEDQASGRVVMTMTRIEASTADAAALFPAVPPDPAK
ncbi:MAG: beta-lactamase family protein [Nannocystaceae bacterium]|nr:beta-lactamase family protein [Nannocystaceae bacterium]